MDRKEFIIRSFSLDGTDENRKLLKVMEELAGKDGWTFSRIVRESLMEYATRHSPGNPQLILGHWSKGDPLPQTLQHKHNWRVQPYGFDCECGAKFDT